jgi:hypothetical protein
MYYSQWDIDGNGEDEDMVTFPILKSGTYLIQVVPKPGAALTDTYGLDMVTDVGTLTLAQDVQIQDIPTEGYGLNWTGSEFIRSYALNSTVPLQGRPAAPNAQWIVPLHVVVTPQGDTTPVIDQQITTDDSGHFTLDGLIPGDYRLWVKGSHTLAVAQAITVAAGENPITLDTLREGDTDDNNIINLTDFSILAATFGKQMGNDGFDARADFNGDGVVNLTDFSLLASNFAKSGASIS